MTEKPVAPTLPPFFWKGASVALHRILVLCTAIPLALTACADDDASLDTSGADAACEPSDDARGTEREDIHCDVAIVGGGAGGLHTAYRLGAELGEDVCLFEKEARLGGRIYDVSKDGGSEGPWIGVGARRVMEGQDVVLGLADELGIELEAAPYRDDVIQTRGQTGYSSDELNTLAFPLLPDDADKEVELYDLLRERNDLEDFGDFRSYVRATVGAEGAQFLTDVFRFRADFEYPLDARGYLDYFDEEWDVCCTASYPVGGMSAFIRGMEQKADDDGVRIFKSEPALSIDDGGEGYVVTTPSYRATADRVVIAVDAAALKYIGGDIAGAIAEQEQTNSLIGVKVASITQWWPEAWWENAIDGKDVRRAWTTESCVNFIEIPVDAYGIEQKVTRSVYDDDIRCVAMWEELIAKDDTAAIEAEIERGLHHMFPDAEIPPPDKTFAHIWPNAWYWLRTGSAFTNADIAEWALEPLPGEKVSLVGESYNPQRSGWSDAAYKSSLNTLNAHFDLDLPGATVQALTNKPQRTSRAQGGH